MGWFEGAAQGPNGPGRKAVITVFASGGGRTAGAAVQLSGRWLLTCAHVVNEALGVPMESVADPADALVEVAFSGLRDEVRRQARVRHWMPRRAVPDGAFGWLADLAVLELCGEPPGAARPVVWRDMAVGQRAAAWYGTGQEYSYADVVVGSCDGPLGYVDGALAGAAIGPGYSGGPLCLPDGTAVGLVVAHVPAAGGPFSPGEVIRRAIVAPWQAVRAELAAAGVSADLTTPAEPAEPAPYTHLLAHIEQQLAVLLGDPAIRADRAGQLAERHGLARPRDGSAPTYREFADFLLNRPRTTADFAELHAPALGTDAERAALGALVHLAHSEGAAALLSTAEHRELLARLGDLCAADGTLLPRAAQGALPYTPLPPVLRPHRLPAGGLEAAVRSLEAFGGDSARVPHGARRVPALLRVAEYAAALGAACGAGGTAQLHAWSDRVARRLGVPHAALAERRQDAAEWADRQREGHQRIVVVELDRREGDPPRHFRCVLWRSRPDGTPARVATGPDRPLPPAAIARLIREAADGADGDPALVEVWVDNDHLQLPVDEWDDTEPYDGGYDDGPADAYAQPVADPDDGGTGADDGLSAPLGEEFHVVLRCRTPHRNASAVARRWAARALAEPLVVDGRATDPKAAIVRLKKDRGCGRVVIHGPSGHRDKVLRACLLLGVPVVLWDRAAETYDHAPRLDPVGPAGPLDGLHERVRRFRVDAYAEPAKYPARPALVWDDPDRPPPDGLWLADPESSEV
ncbi:trypsin-like peptidase domain-containing protein [Actinacidiphila sp. bgisy144]|uniref:VMAP-C domain-containing protein n=1 Tax=Actinacidiphila sp. bgisy144 TaxID=3413791 RepID=UPI003EBC73F7